MITAAIITFAILLGVWLSVPGESRRPRAHVPETEQPLTEAG